MAQWFVTSRKWTGPSKSDRRWSCGHHVQNHIFCGVNVKGPSRHFLDRLNTNCDWSWGPTTKNFVLISCPVKAFIECLRSLVNHFMAHNIYVNGLITCEDRLHQDVATRQAAFIYLLYISCNVYIYCVVFVNHILLVSLCYACLFHFSSPSFVIIFFMFYHIFLLINPTICLHCCYIIWKSYHFNFLELYCFSLIKYIIILYIHAFIRCRS